MALIKHKDPPTKGIVRALTLSGGEEPFPDRAIELHTESRDPELAALQHVVDELRRTLNEQERIFAQAVDAARAEGRESAELAVAQADAKAMTLLQDAIERALSGLSDKLRTFDVLALQVAQAALKKVFGNEQGFQNLVTRAIDRQIEQLRADTIIRVLVSSRDFPDDAAVQKAAQSIGSGQVEVRRDPQLARGDCQIELRLGRMEISLTQHWDALQSLLRKLSETQGP